MIMPVRATLAALLLATLLPGASLAQSPVVAQWKVYVDQSCSKELKRFCKGVPGDDGRLLACLFAREKSLSPKCGTAVMASIDRLNKSVAALAKAQRICATDAQRLCNGVIAGDGNLIGCLSKTRASVSAACNAVLDEALMRP